MPISSHLCVTENVSICKFVIHIFHMLKSDMLTFSVTHTNNDWKLAWRVFDEKFPVPNSLEQ